MDVATSWTRPNGSVVCDRSSCPAPAQRRLDVAGQDFYFCDHHAGEVVVARHLLERTAVVKGTAATDLRDVNDPVLAGR